MPQYLNMRELSERLGVTETAVHHAMTSGRITPYSKSKFTGRPLFDYEKAKIEWALNSHPRVRSAKPFDRHAPGAAPVRPRGRPRKDAAVLEASPVAASIIKEKSAEQQLMDKEYEVIEPTPSKGGNRAEQYQAARSLREIFSAKMAKLDYETAIGKMVDAEIVKKEAFDVARQVRDRVLNVADRIDAELAAINDVRSINFKLKAALIDALIGMTGLAEDRKNGA